MSEIFFEDNDPRKPRFTSEWELAEYDNARERQKAAAKQLGEFVEILNECADELEAEIECRYKGMKNYPVMALKYERDMATVVRARALIRRFLNPLGMKATKAAP